MWKYKIKIFMLEYRDILEKNLNNKFIIFGFNEKVLQILLNQKIGC